MATESTFAERFQFSRDFQRISGRWEEDRDLAAAIGVQPSSITEYKAREEAPPAQRTLLLAKRLGVDPGWLAFGAETQAPGPEGFETWLANRRATVRTAQQSQSPAGASAVDRRTMPVSSFKTKEQMKQQPAAKKRGGGKAG